ncbi:MAG TPA: PfkB family carbohydrate kinase, partial [Phycisphaerae bacterium]|nr:PfkB family carbohydrate kinase [Phycisphaerae bacterium]
IPGANAMLVVQDVDTLAEFFPFSTCLLLQLEIPMDVNIKAARLAHQAGVRVILDPAPATVLPDELLVNVDIITPNQSEAKTITGLDANTYKQTNDVIARLVDMGIRQPIIKMGQHGVCWYEDGKIKSMKAFNVDVIDTVAAGDAFNGGLAAALDEHKSLDSAIMFAQATAAISVTRYGAQQAMPIKNEINAFLATRDK